MEGKTNKVNVWMIVAIIAVVLCVLVSVLYVTDQISKNKVIEQPATGAEPAIAESPVKAEPAPAEQKVSGEEMLSLWTADAPAKEMLISYIDAVTKEGGEDYIPVANRIAVFDLDGTLFCETDPNYFDYTLLVHRVLEDPDYMDKASPFEKEVANKIVEQNRTGASFKGLEVDHGKAVASAFSGLTVDEFNAYIQEFKKLPMPGYEGMNRGDGWYLPMLQVVNYLQANDFTVYVVSGTDRFIVRGIVDNSPLKVPASQIIGSDESLVTPNQGDTDGLDYVYTDEDRLILGGNFLIKNLKMNKVTVIAQEIGTQPVLSFGNSTGDSSMAEYVTTNNPYASLAFMLCCDDTERENGNVDKAGKMFTLCETYGWIPVSMKEDWTTIYGDGVTRKAPEPVLAEPEPTETAEPTAEPVKADPDKAMENFVNKLTAGNYVIDAPDYLKTTVLPDQVYFIKQDEPESALNHAFLSLNGETFEGTLEEDAVSGVRFVSTGNAIEAAEGLLPNTWITMADGNMWDLFYNNVDNPLEFTSKDEEVKRTLLTLGGYGEFALPQMEEVHALLDAEDPTTVRFTAVINDNLVTRMFFDDLDLTLTFGNAETDSRINRWLHEPVYPAVRSSWTKEDEYILDNVFLKGYGVYAVPFPEFASYAMNFDENAYGEEGIIRVTDAHGTEEDLEAYENLLLDRGYLQVYDTLGDGSDVVVYRRLLREDYHAYAELYPFYENGFVLEGSLHYEEPYYDSLEAISEAVQQHGFAALNDTDVFDGWYAVDSATERSESWAYFFDYDLYMPFILSYSDYGKARAYLEEYGSRLTENGFIASYAPGEDGNRYTSANEFTSFRYTFDVDDTVILEFKKEKSLTPEEANPLISQHNLPEANLHGDIGCRDHTRYHYIIGEFKGLFLMAYQPFENTEQAEKFLNSYVAALDEAGYYMTDPQKLGSQRSYLYFNEELRKYVAFDLIPGETGASVNLEFVSIEPDDSTILQGGISTNG